MTRISTTLLLFLAFAGSATANPQAQLTQLYKDTAASPTPNMTFFKGLAALGNFDAGPDVMRAVQGAAELPEEGLLGAFLSGIQRFKKSGDRVTLIRGDEVALNLDGGFIKLEKTIEFRLATKTNEAKIDKVSGARVGESPSSTYPLRSVRFERKDPLTYAHINAGYSFGLNKTKSVVAIDTTPREGIVQAIGN